MPPPVRQFVGFTHRGHPLSRVSHTNTPSLNPRRRPPPSGPLLVPDRAALRMSFAPSRGGAPHPEGHEQSALYRSPPGTSLPPEFPGKEKVYGSTQPASMHATTDIPTSSGPPRDALSFPGAPDILVPMHLLTRFARSRTFLHILQHPSLPDRYMYFHSQLCSPDPLPRASRSSRRAWKCANCTLRAWQSASASHRRFDREDLSLLQ
jgi:hypothetical protein